MLQFLKSPHKHFFLISLIVYLTTAYFSAGYHNLDEHFQILEFCNYKLGYSPAADLPWEFNEKIRPALQPALAYAFVKTFSLLGINNPHTWALLMRLITALLAWYITCLFCDLLVKNLSSDFGKKIFILLTLFSWFVPYLIVRFSSENYSALAFTGALYLLMRFADKERPAHPYHLFFAGLLLGFSFYFRFQVAFAILGVGLWLIFINKMKIVHLLQMAMLGACSIGICLGIDYWFYGEVQVTPLNYFAANIIENKAAQWGVYPWWWYISSFLQQGIPPFSAFLLLFFLVGIYKKKKDIFTWCIIPFLVGHFLVGHKEMRFMFPMLFCFLYLAALGIDHVISLNKYTKAIRIAFVLSVIINLPLLAVRMFIPAEQRVLCYKFIQDYSPSHQVDLFYIARNGNNRITGPNHHFYKFSSNNYKVMKDSREMGNYLAAESPPEILILEVGLTEENKFDGYTTESVYCAYPLWIRHFDFNNWQSRSDIWNIQRLKKISQSK